MALENTTDLAPTTTAPLPVADSSTSTTAAPASPPVDAAALSDGATPAADGATLLTPVADTKEAAPALTAEEQAAADTKAALFGAPDGDYEITGLPEGTVIDGEALAAVAPLAKEMGLSNEGLSKLAGAYAEKIVPHLAKQVSDQIMASSAATIKGWADESVAAVKTDAAYGGKPLAEVQAVAAKAIDRFGGTEFRQYLADTGLGNHPAMVRAMFLAGSAIAEDTTFERGGVATSPKSRVDKYYPAPST